MDRKHDILVFVRPILFLPLPISEDEADDRFGMFMCDQIRNLMSLLIVFYSPFKIFLKFQRNLILNVLFSLLQQKIGIIFLA